MKKFPQTLIFALIILSESHYLQAQDSLLINIIKQNYKTFQLENNQFSGKGWDFISEKTISTKNVLIGEDHFTNEIPLFVKSLSDVTEFDNIYIEVDPYSTQIIETSLTEFSEKQRQEFIDGYGDLLAFYSFKPEYELLQHMSKSGTKILGSDQVVMYADQLIFQDILMKTKNPKAKEIYSRVIEQSKLHLEKFYNVTKNPMTLYFMSDDFRNDLSQLKNLELSEIEYNIIEDIIRSITIYKEQNHAFRIQLILNGLMKDYPSWKDSKNLFKYGAYHLPRGESFLHEYDLGNMVSNITRSNYEESLHIMIIGESGMVGSIFKPFPPQSVNIQQGLLSNFKPFYDITEGKSWYMFNLVSIRKKIKSKKLRLENMQLLRLINGYDIFVVIPEVTPSKLLTTTNH